MPHTRVGAVTLRVPECFDHLGNFRRPASDRALALQPLGKAPRALRKTPRVATAGALLCRRARPAPVFVFGGARRAAPRTHAAVARGRARSPRSPHAERALCRARPRLHERTARAVAARAGGDGACAALLAAGAACRPRRPWAELARTGESSVCEPGLAQASARTGRHRRQGSFQGTRGLGSLWRPAGFRETRQSLFLRGVWYPRLPWGEENGQCAYLDRSVEALQVAPQPSVGRGRRCLPAFVGSRRAERV
jgi:hypothetical protein